MLTAIKHYFMLCNMKNNPLPASDFQISLTINCESTWSGLITSILSVDTRTTGRLTTGIKSYDCSWSPPWFLIINNKSLVYSCVCLIVTFVNVLITWFSAKSPLITCLSKTRNGVINSDQASAWSHCFFNQALKPVVLVWPPNLIESRGCREKLDPAILVPPRSKNIEIFGPPNKNVWDI